MIQDGFPLMGILVATLAVVLAAIEIGYRTGLALSFSLVLLLIADLERPTGGMVQANQSAMNNLLEKLQQSA